MYSPFGQGPDDFTTAGHTAVSYQAKKATWTEELKIALPPDLKKHQLIFTFFEITGGKKEYQKPIGYSAYPLYENGRFPENAEGEKPPKTIIFTLVTRLYFFSLTA